jgi:carotenoid cleavage dioxygenase
MITHPSLFPDTPEFSGPLYAPSRVEADVFDLEVAGVLPAGLEGVFFQVSPDPQFPPMLGEDIFFNGDGLVSAFRFEGGRVSLRRRYVQTERLKAQRRLGRSLNGIYRNVHTNDPQAAANNGTANTTALCFGGRLWALKEDSLPYRLDPHTLQTLGLDDLDGQIRSLTFTAHPKVDPLTGHLLAFAYEAKGDGSRDMVFYEISPEGRVLTEIWFEAPWAAMVHDFAFTPGHVLFPVLPLTVDVERLRRGGNHFEWQPDLAPRFGLLSRHAGAQAKPSWFEGPVNSFVGHVMNAHERGGTVVVDMPVTHGNVFHFFPQADGHVPDPATLRSYLARWTFDPAAVSSQVLPQPLNQLPSEFPRCDERYAGLPCGHGFMLSFDPGLPYDAARLGPPPFQFFNQLVRIDLETGVSQAWYPGPAACFQEPVFVPRAPDAPESDGHVLALLNHLDSASTELVVLDSRCMADGPVARVKLPFRMRMSLHGNWTPLTELPAHGGPAAQAPV